MLDLIPTGRPWQVCMIVACSLRLILLSGFLGDIMCLPAEQRWVRRRKAGRRGDGQGSATLWLGTWSSLSLQLTGVIGFWASLHSLSISLLLLYPYPRSLLHFLYIPLLPSPKLTHTHTQNHSFSLKFLLLICSVSRRVKLKGILISLCHTWAAGLMNHNKFY